MIKHTQSRMLKLVSFAYADALSLEDTLTSLGELAGGANIADISVNTPPLKPGTSTFCIEDITAHATKDGKGRYLSIQLSLVDNDKLNTENQAVEPGYKFNHMIMLTPTEKMKGPDILRNYKRFLVGAIGTAATNAIGTEIANFKLATLLKTNIVINHGIRENADYGPQVTVKSFVDKDKSGDGDTVTVD